MDRELGIIGAGLAGCECALLLADAGVPVCLYEQKRSKMSKAHTNPNFAELVCSNSLRSNELASGIGLLKAELRHLASPLMQIADSVQVPAGKALAVDRELFAEAVTQKILEHPLIRVVEQEVQDLAAPEILALREHSKLIIAAGPMASEALTDSLARLIGQEHLYFYDAIAPIVSADSLDYKIIFRASRYQDESDLSVEGDYLNCPMNKEEYQAFYDALILGEKVQAHNFEKELHFEGCMPIEALAERGFRTLLFGTLKPVGFIDPRTNQRPYALLQLRAENKHKSAYNLVGCQTKLTYTAQDEVFRLVPGLANVEFIRHGSIHRNTFINAPKLLDSRLQLKDVPNTYLIGQISGVEGYVESIASATFLAKQFIAEMQGQIYTRPPETTALGALLGHLTREVKRFQPSNANFGLMPELNEKARKKERKELYAQRALTDFATWLSENK